MDGLNPVTVPLFKKKRFLMDLSEDEFRDQVVRPLYLLLGLTHGKDVCGVDEDGKDCYFWGSDPIRGDVLYVIQTKKGHVKMSANARDNLLNVEAQLRTALNTPVRDSSARKKSFPDYVILAASGDINKKAQEHIVEELGDKRLLFRDSDYLITEIDKLMPQLWYGIDVRRLPYLQALRDHLVDQSDTIDMRQLGVSSEVAAPITEETFVPLFLNRISTKPRRHHGTVEEDLDFIEIPVEKVTTLNETVVLVTGEPGSGKTTSLRRIAMVLAQEAMSNADDRPIPVFLHANTIANGDCDIAAMAAKATQKLCPGDSPAFSLDDLRRGLVVVLIDAFDEVTDHLKRTVLIDRIRDFHDLYPKSRIVLTSRDYPFVREATQHTSIVKYNVSPINLKQAERMVERLSKGKDLKAHQTQELLRRLDNVHGMELSPLLVTVFVATTDYARTDIPANITELFKKFTEMMLGRWDQTKGLQQQYQSQVKDFLLCRVAVEMHRERVTSVSMDRAREIMNDALQERDLQADLDILFEESIHRSGLIAVTDGAISFRHLLLQEFFAGRGIDDPALFSAVAGDFWWTRAIVFYFGEKPSDGNGLDRLRNGIFGIQGSDRFQAAVAVGLALQACYLTRSEERRAALKWVTELMANCYDDVLEHFAGMGVSETLRPVFYYLYGRDAVASGIMRQLVQDYVEGAAIDETGLQPEEIERRAFWRIAGLIEARNLDIAGKELTAFKPSDLRLLLAIHIGLYQMERLQVTSASDSELARQIRKRIEPLVSHLQADVIKEVKSYLLEMRRGRVQAVSEDSDVVSEDSIG